ncbi:uncharacterized protein K452DRAFT_362364 [Aplosporella prunicola CBS 121167]|uniref:Uncharacterized protein n=1 Tax=Aplosporella prunicola CBS 121167 TaxID=1176127 RepID=A0A6A6AXI9_9PEZI|nr:uncharacterized protein K452DRAFT_362364 [Aplosporella prunicola CBS 121167]KAF2136672.1 hypothetical protein K452DRAFT_362364 [Aplosporella prunicola CBS 121167]
MAKTRKKKQMHHIRERSAWTARPQCWRHIRGMEKITEQKDRSDDHSCNDSKDSTRAAIVTSEDLTSVPTEPGLVDDVKHSLTDHTFFVDGFHARDVQKVGVQAITRHLLASGLATTKQQQNNPDFAPVSIVAPADTDPGPVLRSGTGKTKPAPASRLNAANGSKGAATKANAKSASRYSHDSRTQITLLHWFQPRDRRAAHMTAYRRRSRSLQLLRRTTLAFGSE